MNEVGEDLHPQALVEGVQDKGGKVRMEHRFAADELHHGHAVAGELIDHAMPVAQAHDPVGALGPGLGITVLTLQLTLTGDLQPGEMEFGHCFSPAYR